MDNEKKDFISSLNNDDLEMTSSFKDIMSRSDLKRREKEKELETKQDIFNNTDQEKLELTNTFNHIINKSEQKKLDKEKKAIAKEEEIEHQRQDKERKNRLEQVRKQEKLEVEKLNKENNGPFLSFILLIIFLCSSGYLVYNLFFNQSDPRQLYLIFNSAAIMFLTLLFALALKINKRPLKTIVQILVSVLFLLYIVGSTLIDFDYLKVPSKVTIENFTNKNIAKAMKWAEENDIDLDIKYDYSDITSKNLIISQSVKAGTLADNVKNLSVVVSDGPNYDLLVNVPNMVGWNIDDVVKEIKKLKLNNVDLNFAFSDTTNRDLAYRQSKDGKMTRNTKLEMEFSLGNSKDLKPVKLIDLKNKEEFDAVLWLKRNSIKYEIEYIYSEKIEYGKVISTDPYKGKLINQTKDKVILKISKGKKIIAPDLTKMSLEEIIKWANANHLKITYDSEYDDKIKSGSVKRTSVKEKDVIDQSKTIHVIISKGKLKMIDYDKNDLDKIKKFASENNIPVEIIEKYNEKIAKGHIISVSHKKDQIIKNSDTIKIVVSKGKATKIPNFIGLTTSEAKKICSDNKLSCYFDYAYSDETKGLVISQNKNSGLEVIEGSSVTLVISNGGSPSGQNNYTPPTNNSNNNSNNNLPSKPTTPTCTPVTYTIGRDLNNVFYNNSGYSAVSAALYSYFASNYPNVKIKVEGIAETGKASGLPVGGIGPGSTVTSCGKTYVIQIAY